MSEELNLVPISEWFEDKIERPFVIAGPCSAETEEQVYKSAEQISKIGGVSVFRAGIWKPRTRPGNFEGIGTEALSWLQIVKKNLA